MTKYAFIDGAFFRGLCEEYGKALDFDIFSNLNWVSISGLGERTFYYDSLPAKKSNQTPEVHDKELESKKEELTKISSTNGIFVKDGMSRFRERRGIREQKGVDILLAVDALRYAYKGVVDEVAIYTSDLDFYPLFEALLETSCRGYLFYQEGKASEELIRSADFSRSITVSDLMSWCGIRSGSSSEWFPDFEIVDCVPGDKVFSTEDNNIRKGSILYDRTSREFSVCLEHNGVFQTVPSKTSALLAVERLRASWFPDTSYDIAEAVMVKTKKLDTA